MIIIIGSALNEYASRLFLVVFMLFSVNLMAVHTADNETRAVRTVVIDAGHGGHDHGCSGKNSKEKHVALDIALKVGAYIEEYLPEVQVIYTRKKDEFIELHERAAIANRNNADVFISIHCNANGSSSPYGTETFVMGLHRNDANLKVAKRENEVVLMEDNYNKHYDGFDPNSPTAHIIFTLYQNAHLVQSIDLASRIENQFAKRVQRKSRGVKQAGFLVLYKTTMPSVLVETGFLTNGSEEKFLASESGKDLMASAIYRAFRDYKVDMDHRMQKGTAVAEVQHTPDSPADYAVPPPPAEKRADISAGAEEYSTAPGPSGNKIKQADEPGTETIYRVQIFASVRKYKPSDPMFRGLSKSEEVYWTKDALGIYKYMVGEYNNLTDATLMKNKLRKGDFPDAFVISHKTEGLAKR